MRQYEPVWIHLKNTGECKITAPRPLHPRIIKAVKKEKYMDDGFKFLCNEEDKHAVMDIVRTGSIITFSLRFYQAKLKITIDMI